MEASAQVSQSGSWGTFAFLPVTDGVFIQERPSKALMEGKVNGLNHVAGANALEGAAWVPPIIDTAKDLVHYLEDTFPMFSNNDIAKLLYYYKTDNASTDPDAPLWAAAGDYGPTTLNQSSAVSMMSDQGCKKPDLNASLVHRTAAASRCYLRRDDLRMPFLLAC